MHNASFVWGRLKKWMRWSDSRIDQLIILGLLLAALLLFTINLGIPLRDWDEGTVAQVAREIALAPAQSLKWLYPTLAGEPYLNKPPLIHILIAATYKVFGINEWSTRLLPALLTAISIPLLYGVGREIFKSRTPAIFSALIYLTLLPVVRHGRLAMLDGSVLCFLLLMILCVLRSRRDLRWCLGTGIAFGLICLTKGIMGLLLGAIAVLFILWDTPRLLTSWFFWLGILLGSIPVVAWYTAQWLHYGQLFIGTGIFNQSLARIWHPVENHSGEPWYYLLEILKYTVPWLLFFPLGWRLAWQNRNYSWGKLILVWSIGYFVVISVMATKLPWYVLPIYPAIALAGGVKLTEIWHDWDSWQPSRIWIISLTLLGLVAFAGSFYFALLTNPINLHLQLVLLSAALTFLISAVLLAQKDLQFIFVLFWGTYLTLLLFITSPHWVWELGEAYPVKPVAAMIQQHTQKSQLVYTSFDYARPSLNFYSDRQVIPASNTELEQHWQQDEQPYLLVDKNTLIELNLKQVKQLGSANDWLLITINN